MTTSITTFLTYDTQAEEAAKLYTSLFDGTIKATTRYPAGGPRSEGAVLSVTFELFGQTYIALNGGPTFTFAQGFSLMVQVDTQAEIDRLWTKLTENGGKQVQCGWLVDKFGVSWQIIPRQLGAMLSDKDKAKSSRAMQAMMKMQKLDLAKLEAAFDEKTDMKFMLMMHAPRGTGDYQINQWKPEEFSAHIQFMKDLNAGLREAGELVSAEGLAPPGQARIVRSQGQGAPEVTDGPFAESKEFLVGYWIVDVENAERAYAIAGKASTAPGPGGKPLGIKIEVRQVMHGPPDLP